MELENLNDLQDLCGRPVGRRPGIDHVLAWNEADGLARKSPATSEAASVIAANATEPTSAAVPFPLYVVKDGVALLELRAKNGFVHSFRVDVQDIPFLKQCWPFEVSKGGKRKKVIRRIDKEEVPLHKLWLMYKHNLRSRWDFNRVPKCRNHDWLDWTKDNLYLPEVNQASESRREAWTADHLGKPAGETLELLDARQRGPCQPIPSDDPEIIWLIQEAMKMPTYHVTASGNSAETVLPDASWIATRPRSKRARPAGWAPKIHDTRSNGRPFLSERVEGSYPPLPA